MKEQQFLDVLRELVERESPSRDVERVREVASFIAAELGRRGLAVERRDAPGFGVHLVGRLPGPDDDADGARPLLVVTHMDTVHPVGTLDRMPFCIDGDFIRGPGVYDMKGGIAMALTAIDTMAERGERPRGGVIFLVTCDEEVGSPTSRGLIEELAREARAALVLEPSAPGGAAKTTRKGMADFALRVRGKAAHAGIEPEAGASAIHEMARQILAVTAIADPEAGTTVNVGLVRGGTTGNVVADTATARVDFRFWKREEAERVEAAMRALTPEDDGCVLEIEGGVNRHALERTPANGRLFDVARAEAAKLDFELPEAGTGGASDGNFTSAAGCPTIDGLGPDGGGAHTLDERVLRADVPRRIELLRRLMVAL
jgi:glutamate carboxypeptidase